MEKKRNIVEWAMHYRQIVILVVCCLVAFGIYSLPNMRKNEFPDFTIRQGMVVAVAPGNTAEEMIEQVTKPLENYIFSYKEVKKEKTFSTSRDGIVYIQVELMMTSITRMNSGASSSMEFLLSKQIFRRMYSQYRYWMISEIRLLCLSPWKARIRLIGS